ncbi:MAG: hypothetical protein ACLPV4_21220 [Solirubrobacteraceae bacterium]
MSPNLYEQMREHKEKFDKSQQQAALGGTDTPEVKGTVASGGSKLGSPMTQGVTAGARPTMTQNGLPGTPRSDIQGGESTYNVQHDDGKGGVPAGTGQGLAELTASLARQRQNLPGPIPNPQINRAQKALLSEADRAVAKAQSDLDGAVHPLDRERAGDALTRAKLYRREVIVECAR